MFGSDEEVDDPPEVDSDEDLSDDGNKLIHAEVLKWLSDLNLNVGFEFDMNFWNGPREFGGLSSGQEIVPNNFVIGDHVIW